MTEIPSHAEIHVQDEANLRAVLGQEDIPQPVMDAYHEIRRWKHRMIGGPLSVEAIMLVVHASQGMDLVPEPPAQEEKVPGRALDTSEGQIQPDVALVGGTEMWIRQNSQWCLAEYMGPGKQENLRFKMGKKPVQVARADVRFKE